MFYVNTITSREGGFAGPIRSMDNSLHNDLKILYRTMELFLNEAEPLLNL